jgi:hypothetical protein
MVVLLETLWSCFTKYYNWGENQNPFILSIAKAVSHNGTTAHH